MSIRQRWTLIGIAAGIGVAVIIAVVLVLVLSGEDGPEVRPSQITVEEIINQVETNRPRASGGEIANFLPAKIGQDLLPGDSVKTFLESGTRVDIRIREFLRIIRTTPNTVWRLGQFALDHDTIIELNQGKFFLLDAEDQSNSSPIKIVTPAGIASPRGTWMSVEYDWESGMAEVGCFRGSCELRNDLGVQVLTDEQKSTVTEKTPPTEPIFLTAEESFAFKELPEAKKGEINIPIPQAMIPTVTPTPTSTPAERSTPTPSTPTLVPPATPTSVLLTTAPTPSTGPRISENLAPNPSFERGARAPSGWSSEVRGTDAILEWDDRITHRGNRSLKVTASRSANQGWPGWETVAAIPIEPEEVYEFSVWAYIEDKAICWMDIDILDSAGRSLIGTSSGSILLDQGGEWVQMTKALDTNHFKESYPDMAAVKLGVRLSLLYEHFGIPEGTVTSIYYDDVTFSAP
jgi:hypothetical protein